MDGPDLPSGLRAGRPSSAAWAAAAAWRPAAGCSAACSAASWPPRCGALEQMQAQQQQARLPAGARCIATSMSLQKTQHTFVLFSHCLRLHEQSVGVRCGQQQHDGPPVVAQPSGMESPFRGTEWLTTSACVAECHETACTCSCGRAQAQELQARALTLLQGDERVRQRLGGRVSAAPGGPSTRHAPLPLACLPVPRMPTPLLGAAHVSALLTRPKVAAQRA